MYDTIYGLDNVEGKSVFGDDFKKAIGSWDAPTSPYADYFEPKFSAVVQAYVERASEVFKLLPKTTWLAEGDSWKYYETDLDSLQGLAHASTPFATGTAESAPTIISLEELEPAYLVDPWETSLMSRTRATWQADPKLNPAFIKKYHTELLPNQLDNQLTQTVDTVSNDGSSNLNMESIDRILSTYAESGVATHVSHATDGDLHWGDSTANGKIDRSADTDDTFGCGAGDGISLPAAAAARVLSLDYIDDVLAESIPFSRRKRYIGLLGPKTLNEMNKLVDPKQRFLDAPMDVQITMNGVSTRRGTEAGFSVASFISNGLQIPMFTSRHVANETAANRSATVADADIGNIYFIDMDEIELRVAIPVTYLETPPAAMLTGDTMMTRHWYMYAAQLIGNNFRAHAAVKYLKST
jgi:hypothetical protein